MRKNISIIVLLFFTVLIKAQDPQFTQFYSTPMFLNPAFTGLTYEHRFAAAYRNQWPGIKKTYVTYMASYDYNLSDLNSGIGGYVLQDIAGTSNLTTSQFGLNYAYRIKINKTTEARGGLQLGMHQKRLNFSKLLFNDQLITGSSISKDASNSEPVNYFDVGAGALVNSANFWAGVSLKHLNQPNASLMGNIEPLPLLISVHGGYRYIIRAYGSNKTKIEEYVSASLHYRHEAKYDQLDIGAYYFYKFINLGVWYRGLPYKKYKPGYPTRESLAILLGLEIPDKNLRVGYSYDFTVSNLGINNSHGGHELTVVYEIAQKRKRTKRVLVTCPKF